MTDQERAAYLADEIASGRLVLCEASNPSVVIRDAALSLVAALNLLAATPAASPEVRERVAQSISSEGIHGAFRRHSNSTEAIRAWEAMSRIPADDWSGIMAAIAADVADAALSAIRPGDRLPAGVVVPEEPTDAMIEAAFRCPEYAIVAEGDGRMAAILRAAISAAKETTR